MLFEILLNSSALSVFTCLRQIDLDANFVAPVVESVTQVRAAGNANVLPSICFVCILSAAQ